MLILKIVSCISRQMTGILVSVAGFFSAAKTTQSACIGHVTEIWRTCVLLTQRFSIIYCIHRALFRSALARSFAQTACAVVAIPASPIIAACNDYNVSKRVIALREWCAGLYRTLYRAERRTQSGPWRPTDRTNRREIDDYRKPAEKRHSKRTAISKFITRLITLIYRRQWLGHRYNGSAVKSAGRLQPWPADRNVSVSELKTSRTRC